MKSCFTHERKVPLTLTQTNRNPKKTVATPSAFLKKFCVCADNGWRIANPNNAPIRMPIALRNAPVIP